MPDTSPWLDTPRQWTFTRKGRNGVEDEQRTYEQSELAIDGEMALFGLIARQAAVLRDAGFDFDQLGNVIQEAPDGQGTDVNVVLAGQLLAQASATAPSFLSEAAAVVFGIFPVDERGRRNPTYNDEVAFLRATMHTADAFDVMETFFLQNDVDRLRAPFRLALSTFQRIGLPGTTSPSQPPSTEGSTSSSAPDTEGPGRLPDGSRGPRSTQP